MEVEKPSFAPHINRISSKLDSRRADAAGKTDRCEQLYVRGQKAREQLEKRKRDFETEREKKENRDLSFHPHLVAAGMLKKQNGQRVDQRSSEWVQRRAEKVKEMAQLEQRQELADCTFKPVMATRGVKACSSNKENTSKSFSKPRIELLDTSMRSIDHYVGLQKRARDLREEARRKLEHQPGSGKLWAKRGTVPAVPSSECCTAKQSSAADDMDPRNASQEESFGGIDENTDFNAAMDFLHNDLMAINI